MGYTAYYMRTSHYTQNIEIQKEKIEDGWVVYEDHGVSGRIPFEDRKHGSKLLSDIERGKVSSVVVLRLDRLGRDTKNILQTIEQISINHKVPITSLNEGITTLDEEGKLTPMTGLLINVLSSLSEFFYHQNRERTLLGVERGKILGKYKGRKVGSVESTHKFLSKTKVKKIREMVESGVGVRSICRIVECSPNTVYKVKNTLEMVN